MISLGICVGQVLSNLVDPKLTRLQRRDTVEGALRYLGQGLDKRGFTVFDHHDPKARDQAVAMTMDVRRSAWIDPVGSVIPRNGWWREVTDEPQGPSDGKATDAEWTTTEPC